MFSPKPSGAPHTLHPPLPAWIRPQGRVCVFRKSASSCKTGPENCVRISAENPSTETAWRAKMRAYRFTDDSVDGLPRWKGLCRANGRETALAGGSGRNATESDQELLRELAAQHKHPWL